MKFSSSVFLETGMEGIGATRRGVAAVFIFRNSKTVLSKLNRRTSQGRPSAASSFRSPGLDRAKTDRKVLLNWLFFSLVPDTQPKYSCMDASVLPLSCSPQTYLLCFK